MKMLMGASVAHTGTYFVRGLLNAHPDIEIASENATSLQIPTQDADAQDAVLADTLEAELFNSVEGTPEYALLTHHITTMWFVPLLLHHPFEFKLIVPMRHPYWGLRSFYLRDKARYSVIGQYLVLVDILKRNPDNFVLPVDLWGDLSVSERFKKVTPLFRDFLELSMTPEVEQIVTEWNPTGMPEVPYTRELTEVEMAEINRRIDNSRILEKLAEIGVDYKDNL